MPSSPADKPFRERMNRLDALIKDVDRFKDSDARSKTREIVQVLMDVHAAGLEKMLEHISESAESGIPLIDSLAQDDLVASLLLLYGLHPVHIETRVREALVKVRPYLQSHGGNVELLGIDEGIIRLRLQGSCHGCPSSTATLKQTIEEAIYEKAPDAAGIEAEGEEERPAPIVSNNGHSSFALPILAG